MYKFISEEQNSNLQKTWKFQNDKGDVIITKAKEYNINIKECYGEKCRRERNVSKDYWCISCWTDPYELTTWQIYKCLTYGAYDDVKYGTEFDQINLDILKQLGIVNDKEPDILEKSTINDSKYIEALNKIGEL